MSVRLAACATFLALQATLAATPMPVAAQQVRVPSAESGSGTPGAGPSSESGRFIFEAAPVAEPSAAAVAAAASGAEPSAAAAPAPAARGGAWPPPVQEPASPDGCSRPLVGKGTTYHVGPGQPHAELHDVPWLSLGPGDVVNIHHRPEPYRTKIGLRAQGTADAPVIIHGVTDARCNRPVISGENATTARDAAATGFFNKQHSEPHGLIFIYRSRDQAWGARPRHIRIQNLRLTGAHKDHTFIGMDGQPARYVGGAAAIYAIVVEDLAIENCEITRNGNGVFVNSRSDDEASHGVAIRHSRIWDNGNVGSWLEHNLYVQTARALYEGNHIGQLIPGARGSSMKDRSSATVIRHNTIVAAARAIDLVEIEGGVRRVLDDPLYHQAWVYGNLIVNDFRLPGQGSVKMIHWGGDNDERYFRQGTLHFFHNTVLVTSTQAQVWYVGLFDMPTGRQTVRLHGNVIANLGSSQLRLGVEAGTVEFAGTNWITRDWAEAGPGGLVKVAMRGRLIEGTQPGLEPDGRPRAGSPVLDAAPPLPDLPALTHQPGAPLARAVARTAQGRGPDLGAFERR